MMEQIQDMLRTHPEQVQVDMNTLIEAVQNAFNCHQTCVVCADACLAEDDVKDLLRCIRLNLDCADVCLVTGHVLSRQTEPDWSAARAQLQACITACQACGDECEMHASHHEHCRICADACRRCEQACTRLIEAVAVEV